MSKFRNRFYIHYIHYMQSNSSFFESPKIKWKLKLFASQKLPYLEIFYTSSLLDKANPNISILVTSIKSLHLWIIKLLQWRANQTWFSSSMCDECIDVPLCKASHWYLHLQWTWKRREVLSKKGYHHAPKIISLKGIMQG